MIGFEEAEREFAVRTLLTSINGFAELLADPVLRLPQEQRLEYAEIILASGEGLTELVAVGLCVTRSLGTNYSSETNSNDDWGGEPRFTMAQ